MSQGLEFAEFPFDLTGEGEEEGVEEGDEEESNESWALDATVAESSPLDWRRATISSLRECFSHQLGMVSCGAFSSHTLA